MSKTPPPRHKQPDDYTVEEHLALVQAEKSGQPTPRFETDEYRDAVRQALDKAGLEHDDGEEDLSVDAHFQEIRRTR